MASRFKQGKFKPKNPEKYIGDVNNIIYRSSWENQFLKYCDDNPAVELYSSEEVAIPYLSPIDSSWHRYYPDMILTVLNKIGERVKMMVEIKPYGQTLPPVPSKRNTLRAKQTLIEQTSTYVVNQAKWKAAKQFCEAHGMQFVILTEKELFK